MSDYDRLQHWRVLPVLRIADLTELLGLSRSQIARLEADGKLERADLTRGAVHYRTESVVRLVDSQPQAQAAVRSQESASRAARRAFERKVRDLRQRAGVR